ncbi:hypothetical protein GCM10010967_24900 [Dyadobacter beijingensis]|uniref:Uncharacterized protein n=1 Tax=Dyadobacter beijingensis TaxID=365489 RepID=A0ABQ2HU31_9BACT|nr:hypothetical protein [Dyadobacter beijingensis]GGM90831.1 hypothetical protein GCM10010967_24900 [Dyadobacter beijingensis]
MIKELLKYLLPLCILLVDGVSNMYAGSQEGAVCSSPIQVLAQSEHPNFVQAVSDDAPAFRLPSTARRFAELIKAISEEKEEDSTESVSLKKTPRTGCIPAATYTARPDLQSYIFPKIRPLPRFGSLISSHRYLVLRVLRI